MHHDQPFSTRGFDDNRVSAYGRATFALQQLLPTPYPSGLGATAESIPNGAVMHRHQHLLRDAVPRTYGMNAQHNPHRIRYARHQHLIRTPYPRQFR